MKDMRSLNLFHNSWNKLQASHSLSEATISNLAVTLPLDLTQVAVQHENWEKGFAHYHLPVQQTSTSLEQVWLR